jgi:hypothetical protein
MPTACAAFLETRELGVDVVQRIADDITAHSARFDKDECKSG